MKRIGWWYLTAVSLLAACFSMAVDGVTMYGRGGALIIGDTMSLSLVAMDGSIPGKVKWKSSDRNVAYVNPDGLVTAMGPGPVQIDARAGDSYVFANIWVWAPAPRFTVIGTGADHNCGLAEDGQIWCWGSNQWGQLGTVQPPDVCVMPGNAVLCAVGAIPIDSRLRFTALAVGDYHSCGLTADGAAHCWGLNDRGQLGDASTRMRPNVAPVAGGLVFESLAAGGSSTCGITVGNALYCWGHGAFQSGDSLAQQAATPTAVAPVHDFEQVATSGFQTCGRTASGSTYCWGVNHSEELGAETLDAVCGPSPCTAEPRVIESALRFVDLAVGRTSSCGLAVDGLAHCWGKNDRGQLGDGTRTDRFEPVPVSGGRTFSKLATGGDRTCGVDAEGGLLCWGGDGSSFGTGRSEVMDASEPLSAAPGLRFRRIALGDDLTCGVADSGLTWCWGSNREGAVGAGGTHAVPVTIPLRVVRRIE